MANGDTGTVKRKRGRPKGTGGKYTVSSKALAQRRENFNVLPATTEEEKSYNARLIEHVMRINEIATHSNHKDIESMKSCFIAYLQLCQEDGFNVSNLSAYAAMGFYSVNAFEYYAKSDDPDRRAFATFVRSTCAMVRENKISDSKINPVIGIFWQRNYDGLRNDTEQIQSAQEQDDFDVAKSYKQKYQNLIGE